MDRVTAKFVRFWSPGLVVANNWERPIDSLDPYAVEWPDNAYAFTLHERVDVHDGPEKFAGKERQVGPMYYHPDSRVETLTEVEARNAPGDRILIRNMRNNDWPTIVWSRWNNWPQPFDGSKCCVLERRSEG